MKGKKLNLVGRILLGIASTVGGLLISANAAEIKIMTKAPRSDVYVSKMYAQYDSSNNEGQDGNDVPFLASSYEKALEVSSNPYGIRLVTDGRPSNTPYIEFSSAVKGNISGTIENSLKFKVLDPNGLEHREVIAYDVADSNEVYTIPKNGETLEIPLPDLINPSEGTYATWRIETPSLVPGDIASPGTHSVGALDGKVNIFDLKTMADSWLYETLEGENYSWGDLNYDGINNFLDFAIMADSWLKEE